MLFLIIFLLKKSLLVWHHTSHLCTPPCSSLASLMTWGICLPKSSFFCFIWYFDCLLEILLQLLWVGSSLIRPHPYCLFIFCFLPSLLPSELFSIVAPSEALSLKTIVICFMPSAAFLPHQLSIPSTFIPPYSPSFFLVTNILELQHCLYITVTNERPAALPPHNRSGSSLVFSFQEFLLKYCCDFIAYDFNC